ncbi:ABC transporter substrate-binding protein [Actinoalloteichus hymeniacidonis]|uniref:Carbohydrate ABC transporter substrate-binding protein, CUT1 family n=1 Tax=Actinoalloteichus hymeniacidonis TaxID=340345 RepID=A0AAC9HRB4_9PSEU|nr:extracellular solute-binding protein [Actinoalloteichus hymeniacidonis]AOS63908.1 carbohydrate ABC transporter substrate-binding protein, CUT1 family [Actinoalloteichus hymeniacidonis]MBB5908036.1 xylobiose transport system substrate-binding protein [Actinoalloteichus hymeniacidonis]
MTEFMLGRRRFMTASAAGLAVLGLAACGGGNDPTRGGSSVWSLQDDVQNPIQEAAITAFNESAGTGFRLETFANTAYAQRLRVSMGSPNAPAVFFNWGGASIRSYVEVDQVVDLSERLDADPAWRDSFLPQVLDAGRIDGRYYGVPLRGMQPVALFYHAPLFAENDLRPPSDWDELLDLVDRFQALGVTPFALAGSESWTQLMWLEYLVDRIGGAEVFERIVAGEPGSWSDPAMIEAVDRIIDLVDRGAFGTNFSSVNYGAGGASTLFARGDAAMHLMGSWEYTNQLDQQPDFAADGLAWTSFPVLPDGVGDPSAIVGNPTNYFSVNTQAADVEQAVAFLREHMNSDSYVDALISGGDVPAVADIEDRLSAAPNAEYALFVYGLVRDAAAFTLSWDQALPPELTQVMLTSLQEVFLGQRDSAGFVEAVEAAT